MIPSRKAFLKKGDPVYSLIYSEIRRTGAVIYATRCEIFTKRSRSIASKEKKTW